MKLFRNLNNLISSTSLYKYILNQLISSIQNSLLRDLEDVIAGGHTPNLF